MKITQRRFKRKRNKSNNVGVQSIEDLLDIIIENESHKLDEMEEDFEEEEEFASFFITKHHLQAETQDSEKKERSNYRTDDDVPLTSMMPD